MKTFRPRLPLLVFICFLLVCTGLYAQEDQEQEQERQEKKKTGREYKPREQKLYIDIPLTFGEVMLINLAGNGYWRLWGPDSEAAYFTAASIRRNLNPKVWTIETGQGGDTFLTNQFIHPYAGGLYFASARSNNINFYWSFLSSAFGSITWEALGETDSPASSDLINTAFGGIVIGEIMHRLYIELDKGGIAGKIGSFFVSPTDRITAAIRGYGPENSPSKIFDSELAFGFSWINAKFFDDDDEVTSWNTPAGFINYDLVYGDPYTAHSKTPFEQFDLNTSLTVTVPFIHNFIFIAGGYLASWLLAEDDVNQASNGITLHFEDFITDKGLLDLNNGRENLSFNAYSLDYAVKWRRNGCRIFNKPFALSLKTHIGFSPWVVTDYNGGEINPNTGEKDDYNLYLFGGNIKLFMEMRQMNEDGGMKNGHVLALSLCFYDTWDLPKISGFNVNTIFLFSKIAYSFPLTGRLSLYAADSFLLLHCHMTHDAGADFPDITRWYNSAQFGLKISF
jgi:hypothetical protein